MTVVTNLEQEAHAREFQWLLVEIQNSLRTRLADAVNTCQNLLSNQNDELKIVMSSTKSEVLKGIVTRNGPWISNCDISVRCNSINKRKKQPVNVQLAEPYLLIQLQEACSQVAEAAQAIEDLNNDDDEGSKKARKQNSPSGHAYSPSEINENEKSRIALLQCLNSIKGARQALYAPAPNTIFPHSGANRALFRDLGNVNLSVDFYVADSNIVTDVRTFEETTAPQRTQDSAFASLFGKKPSPSNPTVMYNGNPVIEHERIIVGNQDPTLISATSKLMALEAHLEHMVRKVQMCE